MRAMRRILGAAVATALLWLGASSAWAGGASIRTGGVRVTIDDWLDCHAVNATQRNIENVRVVVRNQVAEEINGSTCPSVPPSGSCGLLIVVEENTVANCEVTSDRGAKGLRATLSNTTTGASSDAR